MVILIGRKTFGTPLEESIIDSFKEKCKKDGLPMNIVIEMLMRFYIDDKLELTFQFKK